MNDFNVNAKLPGTGAISGFIRENSVQTQHLQSKPTTEEKQSETQKRQEVASEKSSVDFVKEASEEQLDKTVSNLNNSLQNIQRNLEFTIDKEAGGRIVINVIDKETKDIVRQIPSEEVLELARNLHKISKQTSEKLDEQIKERETQAPYIARGGVFLQTKA